MDSLESLFSLRGHIGLVTGASSGLGLESATALAIAGADVILVARRGERLEKLAAQLVERYRVRALALAADVTVEAEVDRIVKSAREQLGELDLLVNNAGIAPTGRAERMTRETWEAAIALNMTAPLMLSQKIAARLIELKRPGRIINMTSIYAHLGSGVYRLSAYAATKAALANLTRQLAVEWAPHGILVNAIAPGWIPTEGTEPGMAKPGNRERMEARTPMARLGRPDEIRGAVIYLASAASSYVTGSMLAVDGGYRAW